MFSKIWHLIASIWLFGDNLQHSIMTLASLCQHLRHDGKLETRTDQYLHELCA